MKLVYNSAAAALLAALGAAQNEQNVPFHHQNAADQLISSTIDQSFGLGLFSHGCWCAKLSPDIQMPGLGGYQPVDELDKICKDWWKARRCSAVDNCASQSAESSYGLDTSTYNCLDSDACLSETCQIDVNFLALIEEFQMNNPEHAFVTDPTCLHRALSNSLVCEPFTATARPATTPGMSDEEVNDAINDVLGESECTGSDCLQFTLFWGNNGSSRSDLDMWVTEPSGEQIGWNHDTSATGGYLDHDDREHAVPGLENIRWLDSAPTGDYVLEVHDYHSTHLDENGSYNDMDCDSTNPCPAIPVYMRVVANGVTTVFNFDLEINSRQRVEIHSFFFQNNNRNQAPVIPYTGPSIDWNAEKSSE